MFYNSYSSLVHFLLRSSAKDGILRGLESVIREGLIFNFFFLTNLTLFSIASFEKVLTVKNTLNDLAVSRDSNVIF